MDFAEPFEESVEIARSYLAEVDAPLILVGVADDTELRRHFLAALRQRLDDGVDLRDFRYDPQHLSLVEGALAAIPQQSEANGHRVAISAIGLEALPRDKQSEAIKLLNAQRNRLSYARLAVILWLNRQLFAEVANKSYDFYSWSSHTFFLEPPAAWSAAQRLDSLRRSYLQAIVNQNEYVNLAGLAPMRGGQVVQMRMDEVFVSLHLEQKTPLLLHLAAHGRLKDFPDAHLEQETPLLLHLETVMGKTEAGSLWVGAMAAHDLGKRAPEFDQLVQRTGRLNREVKSRQVEIHELLRQRRAIVLGDPGAGKTTMLRYVAYRMAKSLLNSEQPEAEQAGTPALPSEYLPVYLRIGLYAQHLKDHPEATITDFVPRQDAQLPLDEYLLREAVGCGQAIFLLDGLDEIIATAQRREVAQAVEAFARTHPACPVIVTSRVVGYREAALSGEFAQFTIRPFDDAEIEAFVRHWHAALGQPERAALLLEAIKKQEPIRRLASNPLLLTVIALIALRNVKLPNRRVELYQKAAETLVDNWMSERRVTPEEWNADEALTVLLPAIAWHLHTQASGGLINQDELQQLLVATIRRHNLRLSEQQAGELAAQFRRNVSEFCGIFLERGLDADGRGIYGFLHLTFEEYFAAITLGDKWKREGNAVLKPLLHHSRWNEVILLCAARLDMFDATRFVSTILGARSQYEAVLHRDLLLAARVLADDVRVDPDLRQLVIGKLIKLYFSPQSPPALQEDLRKSFAELGGSYLQDDLVEALQKRLAANDADAHYAAADALGAMGERAATEAVINRLLELLADSKWTVRAKVASVLGQLAKRAATEAITNKLIELLADSQEPWVQVMAARALGTIGEREASEAAIIKLLEMLVDNEWWSTVAAEVLGEMGDYAANEIVISQLFEMLTTGRSEARCAGYALSKLSEHVDSAAIINRLLELLTDGDPRTRYRGAQTVGMMGERATSESIISKLLELLNDNDWTVRVAAARALGELGARATGGIVISRLFKMLDDKESYACSAAAYALGRLNRLAASEAVIKRLLILLTHNEGEVRATAAAALGELGERAFSKVVIDRLLELLADDDWNVREAAAQSLAALGENVATETVINRLLNLLAANDDDVRAAAADALGELSAKLRPDERPRAAELFFPLTRKKGKSDQVRDQRNAGYAALRNVLAAEA